MICDEVMSGFGRTGEWFAVDHWKVVPDMITMAKGLTSAYVPLGAVGLRRPIADHFATNVFWCGMTYGSHPVGCAAALAAIKVYEDDGLIENARRMGALMADLMTMAKGLTSAYVQLGAVGMRPAIARVFQEKAFPGGLTYNSHPLACAAALATLDVYEEEGLLENARRMGEVMRGRLAEIAARHPSVGSHRNIGLFGLVELVRNPKTYEPMAPYNGASEEMAALGRFFREKGLYTFVRWNTFFTNPPLTITQAQLEEGLAVIDEGLAITDRAVR